MRRLRRRRRRRGRWGRWGRWSKAPPASGGGSGDGRGTNSRIRGIAVGPTSSIIGKSEWYKETGWPGKAAAPTSVSESEGRGRHSNSG